mgnify:CR=1 FL=1
MKTLREICDELNVSRRAVQGYEKMGLVAACSRTERGYLLYDLDTYERIKVIKFYQELGYSLKEIKEIIDLPKDRLVAVLYERINKLKEDIGGKEAIINQVYMFIDEL